LTAPSTSATLTDVMDARDRLAGAAFGEKFADF